MNDFFLIDKEFEMIKMELLLWMKILFDVVKWLKGENGMVWIMIEWEDL